MAVLHNIPQVLGHLAMQFSGDDLTPYDLFPEILVVGRSLVNSVDFSSGLAVVCTEDPDFPEFESKIQELEDYASSHDAYRSQEWQSEQVGYDGYGGVSLYESPDLGTFVIMFSGGSEGASAMSTYFFPLP